MKKSFEAVIVIMEKPKDDIKKTIKKIKNIITEEKCKIIKEEELGLKKLAYDIKKQRQGYFLYYIFEASSDLDASGKVKIKLNTLEEVLKFIIIPYSEESEFEKD